MSLHAIGAVTLPPHAAAAGGFDHACICRDADHLCVAHTANDAVEVIDLERRVHDATLPGFPGVAGVAVCEQRHLLLATCRREGHVASTPLRGALILRRIAVGDRPNGLAIASARGVALAACVGGEIAGPSLSVLDLAHGAVLASAPLPGRPRWIVHDPDEGCFHVAVAAPPQILAVRDGPPFDVVRTVPIPVAGPHGLELDAARGLLHCACDGAAVVTVEAASGRVVSQVAIAGGPDVVFFNPRRDHLYVAIGDPGVLQVIDTATGTVIETVQTGKDAHTLGFDAEREHVFAFLPGRHAAEVFAEA
jgi:DNA-binding beta-propeller fold protein YncE